MIKNQFVGARALPEEKRALQEIARQDRRRPSDALREMIREEAKRRGLWPPPRHNSRMEVKT